jgi:tRNA-binding protein
MHKLSDPAAPPAEPVTFDQFLAIDIRVGTVVAVDAFPQARKPSWKLKIDFGPTIGIR